MAFQAYADAIAYARCKGTLDGRAPRRRRGRPDRQRAPVAAPPAGGAGGHRHLAWRLTGVACPTGFCHLGGAPISNRNAFGAGLAYVADP